MPTTEGVTDSGIDRRRVSSEARRARQRQAAQAYGEYLRRRTSQQAEDEAALIESSNDIALRDSQW